MDIVFGTKWFEKHQQKLLWLLNTPIIRTWFRWCLRIKEKGKVNRITPNSYSYNVKVIDDKIEVITDFRTHDKYSKRLYFAFKPFWYLLHIIDWMAFDRYEYFTKLSFGFSTLTVYPDAHPETTSVDGYVGYSTGAGGSWATARGATDGTTVDTESNLVLYAGGSAELAGSTNDFVIYRGFTLFDTSALTSGATISAAVISGYSWNKQFGDNDSQAYINVYATTPASNTNLVTADYDQIGTTALSTAIKIEDVDSTGTVYTDFTLNTTGLALVSKTGVTKLGFREGHDVENEQIANNTSDYVWFYPSDQTGTTKDPKLVVTYTVAAGPANLKTYNTNLKANIKTINTNPIANVKSLNGNS
jgi:hypothetical protein